jgi:hypothetical protein
LNTAVVDILNAFYAEFKCVKNLEQLTQKIKDRPI